AAAQAPELYHAYIGVAQFAYQIQSEMMAYDYMLAQYRQMGNHKMVRKLLDAPVSMETGTPAGYQAIRDVAMHELGIGTTRDMHSIVKGLFLPSFTFRGYTLAEKFNFWRGKIRNGISVMWEEALYIDMRQQVPSLEIPVYFFGGVHDYTCNTDLAKTYFEALQAPVKGFYLFAHSAHSPHFEEPQKTLEIMLADVLNQTNTLADEK
ncbi:MAG: alpha/beta hydrolase, partial [Anaerolineae bacterium]|nr:alpha/beta hydrolase [Anaerolineae bacterium]